MHHGDATLIEGKVPGGVNPSILEIASKVVHVERNGGLKFDPGVYHVFYREEG